MKAPLQHRKLMTMGVSKSQKTRSTPKEREAKQVITCLHFHLAWLSNNQQPHGVSEEQCSELPCASNEDGHPHRGTRMLRLRN